MKTTKLLTTAALIMGCAGSMQTAFAENTQDTVGNPFEGNISVMRIFAKETPVKTVRDWMSKGAGAKWEKMIQPTVLENGSAPLLKNFFATAVVFTGTQNEYSGIAAFYNVWQDSILLFQMDNSERFSAPENFIFLPGSVFRGEKFDAEKPTQSIFPTSEAFDLAIIQTYQATKKVFDSKFSGKDATAEFAKYLKNDSDGMFADVTLNAYLNAKLLASLKDPGNSAALKEADRFGDLLQSGSADELGKVFSGGNAKSMLEKFTAFPAETRESIVITAFLNGKDQSVYAYSSTLWPELAILVSVPKENGKPSFLMLFLNDKFAQQIMNIKSK